MEVGALSLLISEKGFDATMAKVAALDTAAAKVGAKPAQVGVTAAPSVATTQATLAKVQQTVSAISGTTATVRFTVPGATQATAALGGATAATQQNTQATSQNTQAQTQQAAAQGRVASTINTTSAATDRMTPKVRSAANGFAALAFAVSSGTPNLQSMALAGGLVATSLLEAFGPASIALYASGIGAIVVLIGTLIAIVQRLNAEAKPTAQALEHIGNIDRVATYNRELKKTDDQLAALLPKMTAWERFKSFNPLVNLGLAPTESERQYNQILATREALVKKGVEIQRAEAKAVAAAQREAGIAAAQDQLRVTESLIDRQESLNAQGYALGLVRLDDYFKAREEIAERRSTAIIRALEAERRALSVAPVAEKPDEKIQRESRRDSVSADIEAERNRQRTASQQFLAEREAAERALAQRIAGYERQRFEAQGRTHDARLAQIEQEAKEFERALAVDPTRDPAQKEALVDALREALIAQEDFNDKQREAARIFEEMGAARDRIQRQVTAGQITEAEGERQIAALERDRIADLQRIATAMRAFATELKNPDLTAAAERLQNAIGALGRTPLGPLAQRVKSLRDELSVAAAEGNAGATAILKKLQQDIDANGGKVTVGILLEAEWAFSIKRQIEEGFAQQEIVLKPKNVILDGVGQALGNLNQQLRGLATNVGDSIGGALASGFSAAFTKGSGKNFFEAAGNAILQGIGNTMVQLGSAMLTYGLLMSVAGPFLIAAGVFTQQAISAPAAIIAGTGLIALGAGLGAIASNNTGTRTGGGAARSAANNPAITANQQVVLDPDRRLREARAIAPTVTPNPSAKATPTPEPVNVFVTAIGANHPDVQRQIAIGVKGAVRRNLLPG